MVGDFYLCLTNRWHGSHQNKRKRRHIGKVSSREWKSIKGFNGQNVHPLKSSLAFNSVVVLWIVVLRGNQDGTDTCWYNVIVGYNHTSSLGNSVVNNTYNRDYTQWIDIKRHSSFINTQIRSRENTISRFTTRVDSVGKIRTDRGKILIESISNWSHICYLVSIYKE